MTTGKGSIRVAGIALRSAPRGPMTEVLEANAEIDGGLVGDNPKKSVKRGITFLSASQWNEVTSELGADLPWHVRRANVLLEGCDSLEPLIGMRIRLGERIEIDVHDETNPCGLMDELHIGLMQALVPDCRGGVFGQVRRAGTVRVGDEIHIIDV